MVDEKDKPDEFQKEFIDRFVPLARQFALKHNAQQIWLRVYAAMMGQATEYSSSEAAAAADEALEEFCKRFPQRVP